MKKAMNKNFWIYLAFDVDLGDKVIDKWLGQLGGRTLIQP
jgi:hypothetical protein